MCTNVSNCESVCMYLCMYFMYVCMTHPCPGTSWFRRSEWFSHSRSHTRYLSEKPSKTYRCVCMYVWSVYTYIKGCTVCEYIRMYVRVCIYVWMYVFIYIWCIYVYVYMMYICVCIYVYNSLCVCMYVWEEPLLRRRWGETKMLLVSRPLWKLPSDGGFEPTCMYVCMYVMYLCNVCIYTYVEILTCLSNSNMGDSPILVIKFAKPANLTQQKIKVV